VRRNRIERCLSIRGSSPILASIFEHTFLGFGSSADERDYTFVLRCFTIIQRDWYRRIGEQRCDDEDEDGGTGGCRHPASF